MTGRTVQATLATQPHTATAGPRCSGLHIASVLQPLARHPFTASSPSCGRLDRVGERRTECRYSAARALARPREASLLAPRIHCWPRSHITSLQDAGSCLHVAQTRTAVRQRNRHAPRLAWRRVRAFKDGPLAARRRARIRLCGKCGASTATATAKGGRRRRGRRDVWSGERRPLAARGTAARRGSIVGGRLGRGGGLVALRERPRPAGPRARPRPAARLAPAARAATI